MPNNNDYSQFSSFDPDNLPGDESNLPESSSERTNQTNSDRDGNGNGTAQTWDRKKLAQLVDFEEETEQRTAKSAVVASNPSSDSPASGEPDNIVSRDELFDDDDPNLSKTERTFSNSPWTKGGLVGVGAMVVFVIAGLFLNNVFNRGKVAKAPPTPTPTPMLKEAPTPTENETGKLKTEIALGTQAEQLAALNRAKSPNNPTPTVTPSPSVAPRAANTPPNQTQTTPTPTRTAYPVYRPPANTTASTPPRIITREAPPKIIIREAPPRIITREAPPRIITREAPPRIITREVVRRVEVPVQQPAPARPAPTPITPARPAQVVRPPVPTPTTAPAATPKPAPAPAKPASPPPDPFAQWQALARVGSYGQADVPENNTQVAAAPVPEQQAELTMPRPTGIPSATAYPAVPGAYALPLAVPVIAAQGAPYTNQATGNDAAEEGVLLNGSSSPAPQPDLVASNPEESVLQNGSSSPVAQPHQPADLVASNTSMQEVEAEEDALLGRAPQPQQSPLSLPVNSPPQLSGQYLQVGNSASGKLITPVLNPSGTTTAYANNPSNPNAQRFAAKLESPLSNAYGQPILNEGTLIVFTVASVAPNGWVNATAESVVFPDGREYRLPPGAIGIRGTGGDPLMAKKWDDKGPEFFSQDANAFLFGALSNVGRVLNQPRSESYEYNSGFGFGSNRSRIERGNPNILGAVLEGGFSPVLANIMQRNAVAMQELRQRANIWYVAAGKNVEVFVNQSFQF